MSKHFEKTLGRMIQNIKGVTLVPTDLEEVLSNALMKRNFLSHGFFREHASDFMSYEGREKMITELKDAQTLFSMADSKLSEVIKPIREKYGFTDDCLEKFYEEYLRTIKNDL
jgi:hypothetical protein